MSIDGSPSRMHSLASLPVIGPRVKPIRAWPVAMNTPATFGAQPTTGRPSGVHGRSPHHCDCGVTASIPARYWRAPVMSRSRRLRTRRSLIPENSIVPARRNPPPIGVAATNTSPNTHAFCGHGSGLLTSRWYPLPACMGTCTPARRASRVVQAPAASTTVSASIRSPAAVATAVRAPPRSISSVAFVFGRISAPRRRARSASSTTKRFGSATALWGYRTAPAMPGSNAGSRCASCSASSTSTSTPCRRTRSASRRPASKPFGVRKTSIQPLRLYSHCKSSSATRRSNHSIDARPSAVRMVMQCSSWSCVQARRNCQSQDSSRGSSRGGMYSGLALSKIHLNVCLISPGRGIGGCPRAMMPALPNDAPLLTSPWSSSVTRWPRLARK